RRGDRVHELSAGVEDLEFDRTKEVSRALVVCNERAARRVPPGEARITFGPPAAPRNTLLRGAARQKHRVFREDLARHASERRQVVHDPDSASMRREDEIVIAGVDLDLPNCHAGEIASLEFGPGRTA